MKKSNAQARDMAELGRLKVVELRKLAREHRLLGTSKLRKAELVQAITRHLDAEAIAAAEAAAASPREPLPLPEAAPAQASATPEAAPSIEEEAPPFDPGAMRDASWYPPELPDSYGQDRLTLMVRDPHWLFCYWEIGEATVAAAKGELGDGARMVLRVHRLGEADAVIDGWEEGMPDGAKSWYVHTGRPGARFRAELGLTDAHGRYVRLVGSNTVQVPGDSPSERWDEEWVGLSRETWEELERAARPFPGSLGGHDIIKKELKAIAAARLGGASDQSGSPEQEGDLLIDRNTKGYLLPVLHHHLPYVRHPEYEDFMEEDWLHQAVVETYLPLLGVFEQLRAEGVPYRFSVTLTPPLISMLDDPLLRDRTERHLGRLLRLAESEIHRVKDDEGRHRLARFYRDRLEEMRDRYLRRYHRDVVSRYADLQASGHLEILSCNATHGFLPLMNGHVPAMRAQVEVAVDHYRRRFGKGPRGIWLGECGYQPGVERLLGDAGVEYFMVDTHGLVNAEPRPRYGVFAPVLTESGVAAFGRDLETSHQVWSAETGYPADAVYREFYRDIGWDLDLDYLRPFLGHHGFRKFTGIKYHRITGKVELHEKGLYDPWEAERRAAEHAGNFLFNRERQIENLAGKMDRPPVIVAPYDAELFGHWWYEGPRFLDYLIRKTAFDQNTVALATGGDVLDRYPVLQRATPSFSSWGYKGYGEFWLNDTNDWIYRHLHNAQERMNALADRHGDDPDPLRRRALRQAGRELLLAQSSDWAFIMKTGTVVEYAVKRTKEHIHRFLALADMLEGGPVDAERLSEWESKDNIFPDLDPRVYRSRPGEVLAQGVAATPSV